MSAVLDKTTMLLHAVSAAVLVGASTHLALQGVALLRGRANPRLLKLYPPVAFAAWAVTVALGALMYPAYRIAVRHEHLDVHAVWASILFDVKENLALFVGPLLALAWAMSRALVAERDRSLRVWFLAACACAAALGWWTTLSGLLVVSVRSL